MKRLILVRHAKSSWAQPGLADHKRPLANRGIRDAARTFSRLLEHGPKLELVVTSDAARALETTRRLSKSLGLAGHQIAEEPRLYHASATGIVAVVRALPDTFTTVACVGHNPGLTDAANTLIDDFEIDNLPTCAIIGMEFQVDTWAEMPEHGAQLIYLDYPKNTGHPILAERG
jgi:phosphohistidine phosphatase